VTEATVLLTLPLRGVVLSDASSSAPDWLEDEFRQMPALIAAHRLAQVEAQANSQAQQELEQLRTEREAWSRGLAELKRVIGVVDVNLASVLHELREAAVELAHVIANKLVFHQIAANTFPIDRLVAEVLSRLSNREPATVRLHPQDLALLQSEHRASGSFDQERDVRMVADPTLSRGDCKAVAGEITVIYELRRQIEEIRRELLSTVSGHAEPGH
jgi:flagellar biosynthesis/type III secretory pathway protein FliH